MGNTVHPKHILVVVLGADARGVFGLVYSFVRHLPLRMQVRKLKKALAAAELDQQKVQGPTDSSTAPFSERLPQ